MRVTVDLAKKHLEYNDYSIEVYKADVIKLIHYIEGLEQKLTLTDVSQQRELLLDYTKQLNKQGTLTSGQDESKLVKKYLSNNCG